MRHIKVLLTVIAALLRILWLGLAVRPQAKRAFPYVRFYWQNRRDLHQAWGEVQAVRKLV
jgi:hypothetical protein